MVVSLMLRFVSVLLFQLTISLGLPRGSVSLSSQRLTMA